MRWPQKDGLFAMSCCTIHLQFMIPYMIYGISTVDTLNKRLFVFILIWLYTKGNLVSQAVLYTYTVALQKSKAWAYWIFNCFERWYNPHNRFLEVKNWFYNSTARFGNSKNKFQHFLFGFRLLIFLITDYDTHYRYCRRYCRRYTRVFIAIYVGKSPTNLEFACQIKFPGEYLTLFCISLIKI